MPRRKRPQRKCLGCSQPAHRRGLCHKCYTELWRQVRRGETTWDEIEAAGLGLPQKRGPVAGSKYAAAATGQSNQQPAGRDVTAASSTLQIALDADELGFIDFAARCDDRPPEAWARRVLLKGARKAVKRRLR